MAIFSNPLLQLTQYTHATLRLFAKHILPSDLIDRSLIILAGV